MKKRNKDKRLDARQRDYLNTVDRKAGDQSAGVAKRVAGGGYHKPGSNNK